MSNIIEKTQRYLPFALDEVYSAESRIKFLDTSNGLPIKEGLAGTGTVAIPSIMVDGLGFYKKVNNSTPANGYSHYTDGGADGYARGSVTNSYELYTLSQLRSKQIPIDFIDNEENSMALAGNTATQFFRTSVVRENDAYSFSKIASVGSKTLGNYKEEDIGANSILSNLIDGFTWLKNHEVEDEDQIIFVSADVWGLIAKTNELTRYISQTELKSGDVRTSVDTFFGRPIITVPDNRFFTKLITTDNGYVPATDSKAINYIIASKRGGQLVKKIQELRIIPKELNTNFYGYLINFLMYYDFIIPKNKIPGFYISVASTKTGAKVSAALSVNEVAGSTTNGFILKEWYTNPMGLNGNRVVFSKTDFVLGDKYSIDTTHILCPLNEEVITTEAKGYFALLDSYGYAIAKTGEITLVKKS